MSDDTILTLRDIANQLNLPESTVRYYRDAFVAYIPTVGRGRRRRYPAEALTILGEIARLYSDGKSREAIEATLGGAQVAEPAVAQTPSHTFPISRRDATDLYAILLEGERERREVMWQMVQEIVRLGEAIEQQHSILGGIVDQLAGRTNRALPASGSPPTAQDLAQQLESLREELVRERELVERLRRSKLDLERRAAEAEVLLDDRQRGPPGGSILARFRSRPSGHEKGR